ncbi:MAG: class I SAM-dependent methyltransferase [Candidatus Zixiibacteriota bacterium]
MNTRDLIEEMNAYYRRRAPWHDDYMSYTSNAAMEKQFGSIIALVEKYLVGVHVLEIACGTGNWTRVLAKRAARVTATDVSPEAVAIAGKKNSDIDNITFEIVDAYRLETLTGQYDIVFAADFFSHIPLSMMALFIQKVHDKIRTNGRVILLDLQYQKHSTRRVFISTTRVTASIPALFRTEAGFRW